MRANWRVKGAIRFLQILAWMFQKHIYYALMVFWVFYEQKEKLILEHLLLFILANQSFRHPDPDGRRTIHKGAA